MYQALTDCAGNVYILTDSSVIRKVDTNGIISTYARTRVSGCTRDGGLATAAQISIANAAAFDQFDNLFFVDFLNHVVRKISASGIIDTAAGTGLCSGKEYLQRIFTSDTNASSVRKRKHPICADFSGSTISSKSTLAWL